MIEEAEEYNADSIVEEERITAMDSLANDARDLKENATSKLLKPHINLSKTKNEQKINKICDQIIHWLDNNHQLVSKQEIQACQEMLKSIIDWLGNNHTVDGEQYEERQTRFDSFFSEIFKSSTYKEISKTQITQPIVPLLDRKLYYAILDNSINYLKPHRFYQLAWEFSALSERSITSVKRQLFKSSIDIEDIRNNITRFDFRDQH